MNMKIILVVWHWDCVPVMAAWVLVVGEPSKLGSKLMVKSLRKGADKVPDTCLELVQPGPPKDIAEEVETHKVVR